MEQLEKTGKASGKGKIVGGDSAFAHGTLPAFAGGSHNIFHSRQNFDSKETINLFEQSIKHLD